MTISTLIFDWSVWFEEVVFIFKLLILCNHEKTPISCHWVIRSTTIHIQDEVLNTTIANLHGLNLQDFWETVSHYTSFQGTLFRTWIQVAEYGQ